VFVLTTDITTSKFVERFNEQNKKCQPQATSKHVRKKVQSIKRRHENIDDTDSSSDDDDCQQVANTANTSLEEWKLYLNTHEVVPDDIGIVRWWGCVSHLYFVTATSQYIILVVWRPLPNVAVTRS
jgi:hypothetical protein